MALTTAAKASVLLLYRRVLSLDAAWFRIGWWANMTLTLAFAIALSTGSLTQCLPHPIRSIWLSPEVCPPTLRQISIMGILNAFIDVTILMLPIHTVWSLRMPRRQKAAICGVFGLGLMFVTPVPHLGWPG